jgi:hypothetical protein
VDEFSAATGVAAGTARALVERDGVAAVLDYVDYEFYLADATGTVDIAEETYGYLAALDDVDPVRDFTHVTLYVERPLDRLVELVPDTYFARLLAHDPDADAYRIGSDPRVDLVFGASHPDRRSFETKYSSLDVGLPTVAAYERHSERVLGAGRDDGDAAGDDPG